MQDFYMLDVRCELSADIEYLKVSTLVEDGTILSNANEVF